MSEEKKVESAVDEKVSYFLTLNRININIYSK